MPTPGILGLSTLDARNQYLIALESPKEYARLPCGLPAELWNIIVDYLHDDKPALMACILACRGWGDFCRYNLYNIFTWNALDEFNDDSSRKITPELHPYPHYVRHLAINGGFLDGSPDDPEWLLPLARHLDRFVSVVHLEVESVDWEELIGTRSWESFRSAAGFLAQIKSVDFSNIPLQPFRHILDSICLFSSLEKLDYLPSHVEYDDGEKVDLEVYIPARSWRTFSTEHTPLQLPTCGFWNWLSAVTHTNLQSIRLDSIPTSDLPSLSQYLHILGGSLREFRVRFITPLDINDFAASGALANNTRLQHLEIVGLICRYRNNQIWASEDSVSFLSTLPGTALSRLVIVLDGATCKLMHCAPNHLQALDRLLSTPERFPALDTMEFHVGCQTSDGVRRNFMQCQRRGVLSISAEHACCSE